MQLYKLYKSIIDRIKPVETAWFTTFNLDVDLTERFLLSCLAGKEPYELRTAEDFEGLNLELQKIDVRIWYDYRALNRRIAKRTTADMISVDPRQFYNSASHDIVFHPKVIFLSGQGGTFLITGSANLTIAGWSTNKEGIIAKEVISRKNAKEVLSFFEELDRISPIPGNAISKLTKWSDSIPNRQTDWTFFHSFSTGNSLFDVLSPGQLSVWSPYFSKHSSALLNSLLAKGFSPISVVPDITETGKARITPEELSVIQKIHNINFHISKVDADRRANMHRLSHAKVWLTSQQIAVGSWNCSYRATGLETSRSEQNIEAGIISSIENKEYQHLLNTLKPLDTTRVKGTESEELEAEWENVLNPFTVECKIIANWETFEYDFECDDSMGLYVSLPDHPGEKFQLSQVRGKSFLDHYKRVLKNKIFTVYNHEGDVVYEGFIIEVGKLKRQAYSYTTFFDLFDSLLKDPSGETPRKLCQYQFDDEANPEEAKEEVILSYKGHESYYMMFVAFQKLREAIIEYEANEKKLDDIGFQLPGSLTNITILLRETLESNNDTDEDKTVFYYFLGMELNNCIRIFNDFSSKKIAEMNVEYLFEKLSPSGEDIKFMKKLKKEFAYSYGAF